MRHVKVLDARDGQSLADVTWNGSEVEISGFPVMRADLEDGLRVAGRTILPSDGDQYMDALLVAFANASYLRVEEQ